jgi:excisionase family DNA binding protein
MNTLYPQQYPPMMTVAEVAAYLNVCTRVAYRLVKTPGFPLLKLSPKGWRVNRDAFFEWLEEEPATQRLSEARRLRETQDE